MGDVTGSENLTTYLNTVSLVHGKLRNGLQLQSSPNNSSGVVPLSLSQPNFLISYVQSTLPSLALLKNCGNFGKQITLKTNYDNIPYPTAFPYGNGTVLHFYQQQESSTTKTVHKVINKGLKKYV